jgi:ribonuclease HII
MGVVIQLSDYFPGNSVTVERCELSLERELVARGHSVVIGVDEVGRGALAGPVSVGAVAWWPALGEAPPEVQDSKRVSEKKRDGVALLVRQWSPAVSVGHAEADEVDRLGIVRALSNAAARSVAQVLALLGPGQSPVVLLDGSQDWLSRVLADPVPVVTRVKADRDCSSVAAASIVAKVERDQLMRDFGEVFPAYGFTSHKGYGAPFHMAALRQVGLSPIHRRTFVHVDAG